MNADDASEKELLGKIHRELVGLRTEVMWSREQRATSVFWAVVFAATIGIPIVGVVVFFLVYVVL